MNVQTIDISREAVGRRSADRRRALQIQALDLKTSGLSNREVGERMGIGTDQARTLAAVGSLRLSFRKRAESPHPDPSSYGLKPNELQLLRSLLACQVSNLDGDAVRSPESKNVSWHAGRSSGWAAATARKRMDRHPPAAGQTGPQPGSPGLGLIDVRGNGYMNLTDAGWALVAALWPDDLP